MNSKEIKALIADEHYRANQEHDPIFASNHEAYAVILEELCETIDEVKEVDKQLQELWRNVRNDEPIGEIADEAMNYVIKAIQEMVQVGAMLRKARLSENFRKESNNG